MRERNGKIINWYIDENLFSIVINTFHCQLLGAHTHAQRHRKRKCLSIYIIFINFFSSLSQTTKFAAPFVARSRGLCPFIGNAHAQIKQPQRAMLNTGSGSGSGRDRGSTAFRYARLSCSHAHSLSLSRCLTVTFSLQNVNIVDAGNFYKLTKRLQSHWHN